MKIQCAWCKRWLGEKPPLDDPAVSHSICPECAKELEKETKKMKPNAMRKGSPEAKAWGERMQALRRKAKHRTKRPGEGPFPMSGVFAGRKKKVYQSNGPGEVRELYLWAVNDGSLYRQVEVKLIRFAQRHFQAGTWNTQQLFQHFRHWAAEAARRYAREFGGGSWRNIFSQSDVDQVALDRVNYWKREFEVGNFLDNPGAAWHEREAAQAGKMELQAEKKGRKDLSDFYHGKEVAHKESEYMARGMKQNPGKKLGTSAYALAASKGYPYLDPDSMYLKSEFIDPFAYEDDLRHLHFTRHTKDQARKGPALWVAWNPKVRRWILIYDPPSPGSGFGQTRDNPLAIYGFANPGRPHGKFTRCVKHVKKSLRQYHRKGDPKRICGAALNPPGELRAKIEGVVYSRCLEVRGQKLHYKPGFYRHPFSRKSGVQILALDNGDLLLHSTRGVNLWKPA